MKLFNNNKIWALTRVMLLWITFSCEEFVEIDPPRTDLIKETVFSNSETAKAAISNIYYQMKSDGFSSGSTQSFTYVSSLSSDEMKNYNESGGNNEFKQFNDNELLSNNGINTKMWSELYQYIFKANSVIEAIPSSVGIPDTLRRQLEGEARFIRGFSYFYLVNVYGDIPLVLSTDFNVNQNSLKAEAQDIYQQIISDLLSAQDLMIGDYSLSENYRVRPNRWAATALLARVYLYTDSWLEAEAQSTSVIDNAELYELSDLDNVFSNLSREAIWQLWSNSYPNDIFTFYVFGYPNNAVLRDDFLNSFEDGDLRRTAWVGNTSSFFFPTKYKSFSPAAEYSTVLRLAEMYLVRAEARANQGKLIGTNSAESDINVIRNRAGLANTSASEKANILDAIMKERKVELFAEWGHRWLDLKRTDSIDDTMKIRKPHTWQDTDALYPIPQSQVLNSKVGQNPGYN